MVSQSKFYLLLEFISLWLDFVLLFPGFRSSPDVVNVLPGPSKPWWLEYSWKIPRLAMGISCNNSSIPSWFLPMIGKGNLDFYFPTGLGISPVYFLPWSSPWLYHRDRERSVQGHKSNFKTMDNLGTTENDLPNQMSKRWTGWKEHSALPFTGHWGVQVMWVRGVMGAAIGSRIKSEGCVLEEKMEDHKVTEMTWKTQEIKMWIKMLKSTGRKISCCWGGASAMVGLLETTSGNILIDLYTEE